MSDKCNYVVLGATGGIGSELCRRLAKRGAQLILGARDEVRAQAPAAEVGGDSLAGMFASISPFYT